MFQPTMLPLWMGYRPIPHYVRVILSGLPKQPYDVLLELMVFAPDEEWEVIAYRDGEVIRRTFSVKEHPKAGSFAVELDEDGWDLVGRFGLIH